MMDGTELLVVDFQEFQKEKKGNITSRGGSLEFLTEVNFVGFLCGWCQQSGRILVPTRGPYIPLSIVSTGGRS